MTAKQLLEWQAYGQVEPFGEWWANQRTANILRFLANMNRNPKKQRTPYELKDFVLEIKDDEATTKKPKVENWRRHKAFMLALAADAKKKQAKKNRAKRK